ncbi:hypothetical protein ADJ73_11870 [Arsenicicoccus sp. oral taxon 190]|nr:hypothetical protein ADJ73_11870 [Arsenicicoccus sp. oral taxon 190]
MSVDQEAFRQHILRAVDTAYEQRSRIFTVLSETSSLADLESVLRNDLGLDDVQAQVVIDLQLRSFARS